MSMGTSADLQLPAPWRRRRGRRSPVGLAAHAIVAVAVAVVASAGVAGASPTMQSTGSSFASVAIQQWVGQASTLYGLNINWQVSSSVIGLNNFAQNQVDFAASDIPYSSQQATYSPTIPYQYLPDVAGGLAFMYNLTGVDGQPITSLVLNSRVAEQIFLGEIDNWDSPAIAAINPQLAGDLPNEKIIPVYRSDASGENYLLSDYFLHQDGSNGGDFAATQSTFQSGQVGSPTAIWPIPAGGVNPSPSQYPGWTAGNLIGENGSDNAANYVSALSSTGSITYVETAYAKEHNLPVASVLNASNNAVQPTSVNVATALEAAILHPDLTQDLTNVYTNPLTNAYPLSAYSYFVQPCSPSLAAAQGTSCAADPNAAPSTFDAAKGQALGVFENFVACEGQEKMALLGYSPLPPNLVQEDFDAIGRLNGAQQPPPPTAANCKNPYVDGETPLPGQPIIQGVTPPGQGGINTTTTQPALSGSGGGAPGALGAAGAARTAGSGGSTGGKANSGSTRGLTAAEIAAGDRLVDGQVVRALDVAGPGRFKRADALDAALAALGGSGAVYVGCALLAVGVIVLPPVIASRPRRRRAAGLDTSPPAAAGGGEMIP
jgi:phosphate transport system substrate-binding protein